MALSLRRKEQALPSSWENPKPLDNLENLIFHSGRSEDYTVFYPKPSTSAQPESFKGVLAHLSQLKNITLDTHSITPVLVALANLNDGVSCSLLYSLRLCDFQLGWWENLTNAVKQRKLSGLGQLRIRVLEGERSSTQSRVKAWENHGMGSVSVEAR